MLRALYYHTIRTVRVAVGTFATALFAPPYLVIAFAAAVFARRFARPPAGRPRLVWGPAPIINNGWWARAMASAGWDSVSYTDLFAHTINRRDDYDLVLQDEYRGWPSALARPAAFLASLFRFDVFFISFNGWFLGATPLWRFESWLLRVAAKKVVVIPFGGDAFVFRRTASTTLRHGLMTTVPELARRQVAIAARVDYWVDRADAVIPGMMGPDGIGRSDLLAPSSLCVDLSLWKPSSRRNAADGRDGRVTVAHAPNFRGFKGSEFLIDAVRSLQAEGLDVELILLERVQNSEVRRVLAEEADILVEQLIATGHGLNGVEGMASGLPVVSNFEDRTYTLPMRRWSFLDECPVVSGSPETIVDVLRALVTRPALRAELGAASRAYAEKYHGFDAAAFQFGAVVDWLYGADIDLIALCDPRKGPYALRKPRIAHPLVENRIQ